MKTSVLTIVVLVLLAILALVILKPNSYQERKESIMENCRATNFYVLPNIGGGKTTYLSRIYDCSNKEK